MLAARHLLSTPSSSASTSASREKCCDRVVPRRGAEPGAPLGIAEQLLERSPERRDVERGNENAVDAVLDRFEQTADCGGDDGPSVRHRLARDEAVSLATRDGTATIAARS